jgi:hypothetical protein
MENTAIMKGVNIIQNYSPNGCDNLQPHPTGEYSYVSENLTYQNYIKFSVPKPSWKFSQLSNSITFHQSKSLTDIVVTVQFSFLS